MCPCGPALEPSSSAGCSWFSAARSHSGNAPMTGRVKAIQVKVKPGARASVLTQESPGVWSAQLKSPPVEGKANEELIALVAKQFGCRKSAVSIKSGASGRMKLVRIED